MTLKELRKKKADSLELLEALNSQMEKRDSGATDKDLEEFKSLSKKIEAINEEINAKEKLEEIRKNAAAQSVAFDEQRNDKVSVKEKRAIENYSILKAIRSGINNGGKLDGIEAEMHQEAVKEARNNGVSIEGIGIPQMLIDVRGKGEKRDITVGNTGGENVETEVREIIPFLRPKLKVVELGATIFENLQGDVKFPRNDAAAAATWEGENDAAAETSPTFDNITLSPNRLSAYVDLSKQLIAQSSNGIEDFVNRELAAASSQALDAAAINGSGAGGQPTGILNTAGIGSVVGGTNGAAPDWADIVDLESAITAANADMGQLAYLTTPGAKGYLKQVEKATNTAQFVWASGLEMNGYRAEISSNVPSDLTKGTGTDLHAILFGNWEELYIGNWGGFDLVVDPYTQATSALVRIVINSWWDVKLRHAASFAAMQDAIIA